MLNLIAFITPKPEHYDTCKQKIIDVLELTRAEQGCLQFEFYETKASQQLVLVEIWKSQQALDEHYAQSYILPIFEFYQDALEKEPEIHKLNELSA